MKKHASLIIGILFIGITLLPADFRISTALAETTNLGASEQSANELPSITDDALFPTPTLYASHNVSADCKNTLAGLLAETPPALLPSYLNIELFSAPLTEFHGLSSKNTIKLNCNLPESRLREVFYHELGHVYYGMVADEQKAVFKKRSATYTAAGAPNYLTEYALTNADEDFAESFAMYFTNRELFKEKAAKSSILGKKYEFLITLQNHRLNQT